MPRKKKEAVPEGTNAYEIGGSLYTEERVQEIWKFWDDRLDKVEMDKVLQSIIDKEVDANYTDDGIKYIIEHREELIDKIMEARRTVWGSEQERVLKEAGKDFTTMTLKTLKDVMPTIEVSVVKDEEEKPDEEN